MPVSRYAKNIMQRFRKFAWLLLLLPVLTGAAGYIFEARQATTYDGIVHVELGEFEEPRLTKQVNAKQVIYSPPFLNELVESGDVALTADEIRKRVDVTGDAENIILLEMRGADRHVVEGTLRAVAESFLEKSAEEYERKASFIQERIDNIMKSDASAQEAIDRERLLYELESELLGMKETVILGDVEVTPQQPNPKLRAAMGIVVGVILSALILVIPELFREEDQPGT